MECNTDQKELNNLKNPELLDNWDSDVLLVSEIKPRVVNYTLCIQKSTYPAMQV